MNNAEFAKRSKVFQQACRMAGVNPTARQARKYRLKKARPKSAIAPIRFKGAARRELYRRGNHLWEEPRG